MKWFWIILAILYIVSPYDLIPDFIPVRGWIDDLVVFILLLRYLHRQRTKPPGAQSGGEQHRRTDQQHHQRGDSAASDDSGSNPHEILGVAPGAAPEEIRAAYRRLANQYHPDKVAHLGKEFQDLAEKRFKEIQQAYDLLTRRR